MLLRGVAGELSYLAVHFLLVERASAGRWVPAHTALTLCPALATLLPSGTLPFVNGEQCVRLLDGLGSHLIPSPSCFLLGEWLGMELSSRAS